MSAEEIAKELDELITDDSTYVLTSVEAMTKAIELMQARLINVTRIKKAG